MMARRPHINRVLSRAATSAVDKAARAPVDAPRHLGCTVIDFSSLHLPVAVSRVLADAFWSQISVRSDATVRGYWHHLKVFGRFVAETQAVGSLRDVRRELLLRYIEWLNTQRGRDGEPWSKGTRYSTYTSLRTLLQWLQRCRPGLLEEIEFPFNPFPWKNRDVRRIGKLPAQELRAILKACEQDIADLRAMREKAEQAMALARASSTGSISTLGGLLQSIVDRHGGIMPPWTTISGPGYASFRRALRKCGGGKHIRLCLYPRAESLLPYYLAILIHTAGNPEAIAELTCDCLQPIPLLDDRELLVWTKSRAGTPQRRSFRNTDTFEPPTLVREILEWTRRLRPHASSVDRNRLFLFKTKLRVGAFSATTAKGLLPGSFLAPHHLPHFALVSIRPSVLTAFYRVSGDLRQIKAIANHAHLSTTVGYLESPDVEAQHRARVAALQTAFVGHIERPQPNGQVLPKQAHRTASAAPGSTPSQGTVVSMFGFNCKDAFAGVAPGTRRGELCTHFLGCFTCPNAVITADAASLARLLQARVHLRAASGSLHPARWEALYAPQLRILEEDILTRFSGRELAAAARLCGTLPPLPELR
jgi:hypothetical protein